MKDYDPNKRFIFIHIPKTAGTSVKEVFHKWYANRICFHYYDSTNNRMPRKRKLSLFFKPCECIYGHFNSARGFGVADYYPEVTQFITFLRDPFDQAVSLYNFSKRADISFHDKYEISRLTIEEYLNLYPNNTLSHFPRDVSKRNYKDIIEECFIEVGLVEHFDESMVRIAKKINKKYDKSTDCRFLNAARAKVDIDYIGEMRGMYRERFPLEYEIYDYIKQKYY